MTDRQQNPLDRAAVRKAFLRAVLALDRIEGELPSPAARARAVPEPEPGGAEAEPPGESADPGTRH